jgi:hypothetical protein
LDKMMPKRPSLHRVTTEAIDNAVLLPQDSAAAALALAYAEAIDADPEAVSDVGPKLLAVLTALGMTPAGRGAKGGKSDGTPVVNKLDELKERREQRRAGQH